MTIKDHELLTPAEVALLFRVDPKTVTRWDKAGKLGGTIRTVGGHRRFSRAYIVKLLGGEATLHDGKTGD